MADDYLWNKEGHDEEVEALEERLAPLRYRGAPPVSGERPDHAARTRLPAPPHRAQRSPGRRRPLWVGLCLGVLAGVLAWSGIEKREADVRRGWNLVPVLVAAQEIPAGTALTPDLLAQRAVPEQFVTSSVVRPDAVGHLLEQRVGVPLQAGDPLLWSQLLTSEAAHRLSPLVHKRTRALSLEASGAASVGGFVRPNDHVDVIGTFRDPGTNEQVAVTLLQNVLVLATGKITGTTNVNLLPEAQRAYNEVAVMVLPEEAELLVLAQELGQLTLTLRHPEDPGVIEDRGRADLSSLLTGERTRTLQSRRRAIITVIRGSTGAAAAPRTPEGSR